ncbi:MAG: preprotein translocase subunit SecG [Gammaproteobacteria bacterium]
METLQTVLLVVQVLVAIGLIGIILIQHGKGADAGAAFGSGASSTVFGAQGSGNFLTRATSVLALVFLLNSLSLAYIATQRVNEDKSLMRAMEEGSVTQPVEDEAAEDPEQSDIPAIPE